MKGQLSFFNEAEVLYNKDTEESEADKMLQLKSCMKRPGGNKYEKGIYFFNVFIYFLLDRMPENK